MRMQACTTDRTSDVKLSLHAHFSQNKPKRYLSTPGLSATASSLPRRATAGDVLAHPFAVAAPEAFVLELTADFTFAELGTVNV